MAESIVNLVIDNLVTLLVEETKLLKGVHKEVEDLVKELRSIQSFLKDADARADNGDMEESVKNWVQDVRETAYQIEDVVDEYILHIAQRPHRRGFKGFLNKVSQLIRKLKMCHKVASEIQDINKSIRDVKERGERYRFQPSQAQGSSNSGKPNTSWHDPRVASLFIDEAEIVGIETPRDELVTLLVDGASKRTVVSVVGMGGLGKTTLAKKVYDHQRVTGHFDCHAWITVSQSYKMDEVLRSIMNEFCKERRESAPKEIDTMGEAELIKQLREYLQQKSYVVVFDDVWGIDLWRTIRYALLDNDKGSRIIITTRIEDVAFSCKESHFDRIYELQPLPLPKAWELFCNKAFLSDFGGCCPPELKQLSLEIIQRCEGLPLAIVAIGGLLSTKSKDVFEWQKFLDSLGSELQSNPHLTIVTRILFLSYHDLPYHLKSFFLYFGIFPEDYSIKCMRLIRLWIAEGFVKGKQGLTLEQVAQENLTELIRRSLVQVSEVDFEGRVRSCRVHDVIREIVLSKSKELRFCQVMANEDSGFDRKTRRLSIHDSKDNDLQNIGNSPFRSIFLFVYEKLPRSLMSTYFTNFKLLKVLDFEMAALDFVPEEMGDLFHLSYLSLHRTKVGKLPKSIGKLYNLQTLNLKYSLVHELPMEINLLHKLRHLLAFSYDFNSRYNFNSRQGVKIHEGVGCLEALQKLCHVDANQGISLIAELRKLRQLRKLGIRKLTKEYGKVLCESIEEMNHLNSLNLHSASEDEILDIHHILLPPQSLQRIFLQGRLANVPNWIAQLQNLVKLRFYWTGLTEDPLQLLQALPKLLELGFHGGYAGDQLYFEKGGFQKLKVLRLSELSRLNNLIIDKDTLPLLEKLIIGPCPLLEKMPLGIQHLRKLTTLNFNDMPHKFVVQLRPGRGELYWVVEHIPAIFVKFAREDGGGFHKYTLR